VLAAIGSRLSPTSAAGLPEPQMIVCMSTRHATGSALCHTVGVLFLVMRFPRIAPEKAWRGSLVQRRPPLFGAQSGQADE